MNWISTGAIFSGLSVMLGAMGAHSLKNILTEKNLSAFREQVESAINGKISTTLNGDESLLDIFLKNNSGSFKNIRLMLLLPPGLVADELVQMMGVTIRGGQEKNIKVAVKRKKGSPAVIYPPFFEYRE